MKKLVCVLAIIAMALPAMAAKTLQVDFTFEGSAASFNLYMDGIRICSSSAGADRHLSCSDLEINYGVHMFTKSAVTAVGLETKHSAPFTWSYASEPGDGPTQINLSVTLESGEVVPLGKIAVQR